MIEEVSEGNLADWVHLASLLWSPNRDELEKDYHAGAFPYQFLYREAGLAIAFMSLSIRKDYVEGASSSPVAYLEGIYVLPAYRKTGVASSLLAYAKTWAGEQGFSQLASNCDLANETSRLFHERIGFDEVARTIHFILDVETEER